VNSNTRKVTQDGEVTEQKSEAQPNKQTKGMSDLRTQKGKREGKKRER
jgi:hypothetical protein